MDKREKARDGGEDGELAMVTSSATGKDGTK
jgi:hypothetical protein